MHQLQAEKKLHQEARRAYAKQEARSSVTTRELDAKIDELRTTKAKLFEAEFKLTKAARVQASAITLLRNKSRPQKTLKLNFSANLHNVSSR